MSLPVEELFDRFRQERDAGHPVVVQSPTGSGKSSLVPLWCLTDGAVLVVEPRRVAARALSRRCAQLLDVPLGGRVGYATRGDACFDESTQLLFVTPGVAVSMLGKGRLERFATVILDEFHERRAETDLLLAQARAVGRLDRMVLLSATLETRRLVDEWGFVRLESQGREFPVDVEHFAEDGQRAPEAKGLAQRVERAVVRLEQAEGTVLVFLPGVGEISETAAWLASRHEWEVLPLHGGLSPDQQDRVFAPRVVPLRVVLSTNVAESAVTVPDVVAVIDSGLERRMERDGSLLVLSLGSISQASADQRTGRAGRTAPGRAIRLWHHGQKLRSASPPEVLTDEPTSWVLAALAAGLDPMGLPWLDRPLASSLRRSLESLEEAGLVTEDSWSLEPGLRITRMGLRALEYPMDPLLAALCVRLEDGSAWKDGLALAAALSGRSLLLPRPDAAQMRMRQELSGGSGDAGLLAAAVQADAQAARSAGIHLGAWREAREEFSRLCARMGCEPEGWPSHVQGKALGIGFARILPTCLRMRQGTVGKGAGSQPVWSAPGGRSLRLSQGSLAAQGPAPELMVTLCVHGSQRSDGKLVHTAEAVQGLTRSEVVSEGLGRMEVLEAWKDGEDVWVKVRHYVAGRPVGDSVREATDPALWAQGVARLWLDADLASLRQELSNWWMWKCLQDGAWSAPPGDVRVFLTEQLLLPEILSAQRLPRCPVRLPRPAAVDADALAQAYPDRFSGPDWTVQVQYDVWKGRVELRSLEGKPPVHLERIARPAAWNGWSLSLRLR